MTTWSRYFLRPAFIGAALTFVANVAVAQTQPAYRLITLDPGHFHASLVQKFMSPDVDSVVHVYAPAGDDLAQHLARIAAFNTRADQPTHWKEVVYSGPDYFRKMLAERAGNIVVIAGNNAQKTDYIARAIDARLNVFGDKPMVVTPKDLVKLRQAFKNAESKKVLLYDIMTERNEITNTLQRELSMSPALFGALRKGTPDDPAIRMESVHFLSKVVAGMPLRRPQWFFDVKQEGEGLQDVGTHLIDLVQWEAFPNRTLRESDVVVSNSRRWATPITPAQFKLVTGAESFPMYLAPDVKDGVLQYYCNGEVSYRIRGVHARVAATWDFEAPPGSGDTHHSVLRGTKATLEIRQGAAEKYKPMLYVTRAPSVSEAAFESAVTATIASLQTKLPGVAARRDGVAFVVTAPAKYDVGHEAHFGQVTANLLDYLRAGKLPAWEVPNMLVKYSTLMQAYALSHE
ncbi:MAG: putative oxidoreductase C-terminal domain-containing protein [Gemmatimonadaceae bacterium]